MHLYLDFNAPYLAAILMGFLSSLHCIGMCGSIIGTLSYSLAPEIRNNKFRLFALVFNYNLGRILSYALAGGLVGFLSSMVNLPFDQGQGHRILQILSAIVMTGAGLHLAGWFPRFAYIEKMGVGLWKLVEPFGRKLIPVHNSLQALFFGMIWGWLPCGLIYTALALAATTGDVLNSSMTMLAFGLGTLPAVMGIGIMTQLLARISKAKHLRQAVGVLFIIFAMLAAFPSINPMRVEHIMTL